MLITDEKFFGEVLNVNIPALSNLLTIYKKKGLAAAEKQFADYITCSCVDGAVADFIDYLKEIRLKG